MKIRRVSNRIGGLTLVEFVVVIFVIVLLMAMLIPPASSTQREKALRINCINNLKEIGVAVKIWQGDNNNKMPMQFYATNHETMKLVANGNSWALWQTMSNELITPKILHCTADKQTTNAISFTQNFSDANISYFFNLDASDAYPQTILDGDDNLAINGVRVPPGILNLGTNANISWTKERHGGCGNLGMADGSVQQATIGGLSAALVNSSTGTNSVANRFVIP